MKKRLQTGFTLIELMIAMVLGLVLASGIINLFLESKVGFLRDDELARLQENGRVSLRILARDISMAGFYGRYINVKSNLTTALSIPDADECAASDWALTVDNHIEYSNDITASPYGCIDIDDMVTDSDVIAIKRTLDDPSVKNGTVSASSSNPTHSDNANRVYLRGVNSGDTISLVTGASVTAADVTAGSAVDLWEYVPRIYFIRDHATKDGGAPADTIPTLCQMVLNNGASLKMQEDSAGCLVEGVQNLQVEFGIDSDNDTFPDRYTDTPSASDLNDAVSARIYVLVRSINTIPNYTDNKTYLMGTKTVGPLNDSFYRRVFSTTVALRNPYNL